MPDRVLAIAAHPDDIEFVMSGTMMLLKDVGFELHYMNIANGCCGSSEHDAVTTAKLRCDESIRAADYLGAVFHESLTEDLAIFYDQPTLARLGSVIRQVAPSIMLVHSPQDYMEDHMNACRLAVTAAFARGMPNFRVEPVFPPVQQEVTIYHAQPHGNCDGLRVPVVPDLFVDVGSKLERKSEMLACHDTQRRWLDESQGMGSYVETMKTLLHAVGQLSNKFAYAEGWRRHSHLGFCAETSDPLRERLKDFVAG